MITCTIYSPGGSMFRKAITLLAAVAFSIISSSSFANTLPLPANLIALASPAGTQLFNRSYIPKYFWPLALQFVTQQNLAYCSIASSVMVLNALDVPAPVDPDYSSYHLFTQNNFFTPAVEKVLPAALVKKQGAALDKISAALATFPVIIKTIHADKINVAQFRTLAENVIATEHGYIIVNFLRTGLGEQGGGHLSPLVAYDKKSDRFLMLDVARYRYPSVWVKTQDLWNAMDTFDKNTHIYRGMVIVQKQDDHA